MKRGAERQIQREDGEDPHAAEGDTGSDGQSGVETEVSKSVVAYYYAHILK